MDDRCRNADGSGFDDDPAAQPTPAPSADASARPSNGLPPDQPSDDAESAARTAYSSASAHSGAPRFATHAADDGGLKGYEGLLALTLMLAGVTSIGPFGLQVVAPGLPVFAQSVGVSNSAAQLIITLATFSVAIGAVVYGPLADRFGRRPVLLGALAMAFVGATMAMLAPSFEIILVGRVLQSLGAGAGMVLARAVARDLFGLKGAAAMIARITGFMVIAPLIAPTIGGVLMDLVGWRGVFGAIALLAAGLLVWVWLAFEETLKTPSPRLDLASVFADFRLILGRRAFRAYCGYAGLSIATFFLFVGGAPYVMSASFGLSPLQYALLFVGVSIAFMTCNFLSAKAAARWGARQVILISPLLSGIAALLATAALALGWGGWGWGGALLTLLPCVFHSFSAGLATPQAIAGAVNAAPERAGSASGLTAVVQFGMAGLAAQLAPLLPPTSPVALMLCMAALSLMSTALFWLLGSGRD